VQDIGVAVTAVSGAEIQSLRIQQPLGLSSISPSLCADFEEKLVVSVRLDLANLSNQVDYETPTEIARQLAADKTFQQLFVVVSQVCTHAFSIAPRRNKAALVFHLHPGATMGTGVLAGAITRH
jgi:hypothetical protein